MKTEFEIKILDIDLTKIEKLLKELGFKAQPVTEFKRFVYNVSDSPKTWLRLRSDGVQSTLTLKKAVADSIEGIKELEVNVDNFIATNELLNELGFIGNSYQENLRTTYVHDEHKVEICIDSWPHIPPYLEIEAADKATVELFLKKLNPDNLPVTSAPTSDVYERYGLDLSSYSSLTFE